jgi:hypothetical protein
MHSKSSDYRLNDEAENDDDNEDENDDDNEDDHAQADSVDERILE